MSMNMFVFIVKKNIFVHTRTNLFIEYANSPRAVAWIPGIHLLNQYIMVGGVFAR